MRTDVRWWHSHELPGSPIDDAGPPVRSTSPEIQPGTVEALLETVRGFLRDEDAREQSFTGRAVGLSGFSGLVLSLTGPVSVASAQWSTLVRPWKGAAAALLGIALICLLGTVVTAIVAILMPKEYASIAMREIARYPLPEYVTQPRHMVQGTTLRGLVDALASERGKNASKATALKVAYWFLLAGLLGVTTLAVILGFHAAGLI